MSYAIKRTDQGGGYLAKPPANGWTNRLDKARIFTSHEAAERERCPENEVVVDLEAL